MSPKKRFQDLSPRSRKTIFIGGFTQIGLLIIALLDLRKRPAEQVRGPKKAWYPALFINLIGPLTYLRFGRRK